MLPYSIKESCMTGAILGGPDTICESGMRRNPMSLLTTLVCVITKNVLNF